jgi:hypothetical protein
LRETFSPKHQYDPDATECREAIASYMRGTTTKPAVAAFPARKLSSMSDAEFKRAARAGNG